MKATPSAIRAARAAYNRAIVDHDAEAIVAHMTDDYQLRASNGTELSGRATLLQHWQRRFATDHQAVFIRNPSTIVIGPDAESALESGDWTGHWCGPEGPADGAGTYTAEWRLQDDGRWRVASEWFVRGDAVD